jgi:GntR family transcriptional regulator, transcriptional repressor for pyruvate dehydrogenase complex
MNHSTLKPIRKKRLYEEIILAIEEMIRKNNIQPGERLPSEKELSTIFDVGKATVREALSVLQTNGVVESRPGSGIYLKELGNESIADRVTNNLMEKEKLQDILEFRSAMEVSATALAAIRASDEDLKKIIQAHQNLIEANESGLIGVKEDFSFHYSIVLASHNALFKDIFKSVSQRFEEEIRISKMQSAKIPGRFPIIHKEHEAIVKALIQKEPQLASNAMKTHLDRTERKIWQYLK